MTARQVKQFIHILEDNSNDILVSVVSYWEITIKQAIGKLIIDGDIQQSIDQSGFSKLNLEYAHINYLNALPLLHKDPFDRLLIAQSISEKCTLLTTDKNILQYQS